MLLSRSRGVQTDPAENDDYLSALPHPMMRRMGHSKGLLSLSDVPSITDHTSDTSSISGMGSVTAPLPELIERLTALLTKLNQTTVESLTTRLKRQNLLAGSDISHLSRSSIAHIQNDVAQLRTHFRGALEVEKALEMTRKDLRNLLRFAKDVFTEMGRLKAVVNDVTLDPSNAARVLAGATDDKAAATTSASPPLNEQAQKDRGWIAPITKLFAPAAESSEPSGSGGGGLRGSAAIMNSLNPGGTLKRRPPPRPVPKLAPAVSSSTTTVNVEFTSSRSQRAVSSTVVATSSDTENGTGAASSSIPTGTIPGQQKKPRLDDLLGIFAGAPPPSKPELTVGESWVVLPRDALSRKLRASSSTVRLNDPATDRARRGRHRLSRNVDAIVDNIGQRHGIIGEADESAILEDDDGLGAGEGGPTRDDFQQTILERTRTLRPRGLSDSSIRSTFLAAGGEDGSGLPVNRLLTPASLALSSTDTTATAMGMGSSFGAFDRQNVLKNLSKRMQSFTSYYIPSTSSISESSSQPPRRGSVNVGALAEVPASSSPSPLPASSPPRPIPSSKMPSPHSPINSPSRRGPRTPGTTGSPSTSSAGRIPVLSSMLAAVVDSDWSDNEQAPHPPRRAQEDWVRRDRF